ncbi:DUF3784 domain-containing protein [Dysgonomonas sp. 520]|uniref:DUF3784 domain-containing protein n=1 Tax=Dysgonomonas sp. 520 TaxID=2302931 RepID=UPI0013D604D8|nr:DUF3784 domain-containing protein [Dysgonomonas sp. 520]NDW09468.1 DUF3784 domain-containing protein [Dysgonomonas sp. 520]
MNSVLPVYIVLFVVLLAITIVFYLNKGESLVAGYNTMKDEEKEKYDKEKIFRFMRRVMLAYTISILCLILKETLKIKGLEVLGFSILTIASIYLIISIFRPEKMMK